MKHFRWHYLIAPSVYGTISYLSLTSHHFESPIDISWIQPDKAVHSGMYFTLALASVIQLGRMGKLKSPKGTILWAFLIPILFGGVIELMQHYFVPGRTGDWFDFLANTIGVILAYVIFKTLLVRLSWISPDQSLLPGRDHE